MAGASLEAAEEIAEEASDAAELIADSAEETADETAGASDEAGAAEEDGAGASELTAAELEGATGVTGVGVPRLKIQMRPMITITATMMIIQVLRFILLALFWRRRDREVYALTLCRLPNTRLAILIRHWRRSIPPGFLLLHRPTCRRLAHFRPPEQEPRGRACR